MKHLCFSLVLLASCGNYQRHIDPELQPWYDVVHAECPSLTHKTNAIKLMNNSLRTHNGFCQKTRYIDGIKRVVVVDRGDWHSFSDTKKKLLLLHELLHCERGLRDQRTNPADVMYFQDVDEDNAVIAYEARAVYCRL